MSKEIPPKYRKHFVDFSPEEIAQRVSRFRVDPAKLGTLAPVLACGLRGRDDKVAVVKPGKPWEKYIHYLEPRSLDDLKDWFGVPDTTARANPVVSFLRDEHESAPRIGVDGPLIGLHHLPAARSFTFQRLKTPERMAVVRTAEKLLYGPVDRDQLEKPPLSAVVKHMLDAAGRVPAFFGRDLLVCPDHTVSFGNLASVYFNNVVVVGNGQIDLGNKTKLHALQITHA